MRLRIIPFLTLCLSVIQCTDRQQEYAHQPIQFYLEDGRSALTKSVASLLCAPIAIPPVGNQQDTLWLAAVVQEMNGDAHTKGIPYTSSGGFPTDKELGLIAYRYDYPGVEPSAWTLYTEEDDCRPMVYDSDAGRWLPAPDLYYPDSGEGFLRFFAFGPYDPDSESEPVTEISAEDGSAPALSYTVPSDITSQRGLLVAASADRHYPPRLEAMSVPLSLSHVLSGVRFAVYNGFELVSATVSGVYDQGEYDILGGGWSDLDTSSPSYTISISDYAEDMVSLNATYDQTVPRFTMMMIPQQLPAEARITVQLEGEIDPHVIDVGGQLWEKGKLVTYIIADEYAVFTLNIGDYPTNTEEILEDE